MRDDGGQTNRPGPACDAEKAGVGFGIAEMIEALIPCEAKPFRNSCAEICCIIDMYIESWNN